MQSIWIYLLLIHVKNSTQGKETSNPKKQLCFSCMKCDTADRCWVRCGTQCTSALPGGDHLATESRIDLVRGSYTETSQKYVDIYLHREEKSSSVSFLTAEHMGKPRDVYVGSMSSNSTVRKTGLQIKEYLMGWSYDKGQNTLFWCNYDDIFKQVLDKNTSKVKLSGEETYTMAVSRDQLYYGLGGSIMRRSTSPGPAGEVWYRSDVEIDELHISGTLICLLQHHRTTCLNLLTKSRVIRRTEEFSHYKIDASHDRIAAVYGPMKTKGAAVNFTLRIVERYTGREFCRCDLKVKTGMTPMFVRGSFVYYKYATMDRFEGQEFGMDCNIHTTTLSAEYPKSDVKFGFAYLFF